MAAPVPPDLFSAEQIKTLRKIDTLLSQADKLAVAAEDVKWQIGELLIPLVDDDGKSISEIAQWFRDKPGRSRSILSRHYSNAKEFPRNVRKQLPEGIPYQTLAMVRQSAKAIERNIQKQLGRHDIELKPAELLEEFPQLLTVTTSDGTGRRGSRDITKELNRLIQAKFFPDRLKAGRDALAGADDNVIDHCHFLDFAKVMDMSGLPDYSIRLLHLDPPYGQYNKMPNGKHDMTVSSAKYNGCHNNDREGSLRVVIAAIKRMRTKLRPNGCAVLWQAGTYLRKEILQAAEDDKIAIRGPFIWNKKRAQAGDNSSAVSISIEFAWLLFREEDTIDGLELANGLDNNDRRQVIDFLNIVEFKPVHMDAAEVANPKHTFEKPHEWNHFFIDKLTVPGDLIFDAFGCTGSMCVAAIEKDRRWVYCETHEENYGLGSGRIAAALKKQVEPPEPVVVVVAPRDKHDHPKLMKTKKLALELMEQHGVPKDWKFKWLSATVRRLGHCNYANKIIGLNHRYAQIGPEDLVKDTILHEIAHALCPAGEGHGSTWKAKCVEIGAKPVRIKRDPRLVGLLR